jgi:hypothetical protein
MVDVYYVTKAPQWPPFNYLAKRDDLKRWKKNMRQFLAVRMRGTTKVSIEN